MPRLTCRPPLHASPRSAPRTRRAALSAAASACALPPPRRCIRLQRGARFSCLSGCASLLRPSRRSRRPRLARWRHSSAAPPPHSRGRAPSRVAEKSLSQPSHGRVGAASSRSPRAHRAASTRSAPSSTSCLTPLPVLARQPTASPHCTALALPSLPHIAPLSRAAHRPSASTHRHCSPRPRRASLTRQQPAIRTPPPQTIRWSTAQAALRASAHHPLAPQRPPHQQHCAAPTTACAVARSAASSSALPPCALLLRPLRAHAPRRAACATPSAARRAPHISTASRTAPADTPAQTWQRCASRLRCHAR